MLVTGIERNGCVRTQLCSIVFICIYDIYHPKGPWYMSAWRTLYLKETQMRVDQQFIWEPDLSRSVWIHESKFPVLGLICKLLECALPSTPLCLEKAAVLEKRIPNFPAACFQQHPEPGLQGFAPMQHQLKEFGDQWAGGSGHILLALGEMSQRALLSGIRLSYYNDPL